LGLLDFAARLCGLGLGARDLSAGVGTDLLHLGLRRHRGSTHFGEPALSLGSYFFNFRESHGGFLARVLQLAVGLHDFAAHLFDVVLSMRDLTAGVSTELLGVGLRVP
jgi:hypothetical protein